MDDFSIERTLKGFPAEVRDFLRIDKREKKYTETIISKRYSKERKNNSSQNLVVLDTSLSQNLVDFDGQFSHFLIF